MRRPIGGIDTVRGSPAVEDLPPLLVTGVGDGKRSGKGKARRAGEGDFAPREVAKDLFGDIDPRIKKERRVLRR